MGTYTTNYNLFLPNIGEQGWGELVNGNFITIDTTMTVLNTHIRTLETETDELDSRIATLNNKLGTGTYISGVAAPSHARLSTTNEGYGLVSSENTNNEFIPLRGVSIQNPTDTYTVSFTFNNGSSGSTTTITIYAKNLLDGTSRVASSQGIAAGKTGTVSANLYVAEIPYYSRTTGGSTTWNNGALNFTKPAIYINQPI